MAFAGSENRRKRIFQQQKNLLGPDQLIVLVFRPQLAKNRKKIDENIPKMNEHENEKKFYTNLIVCFSENSESSETSRIRAEFLCRFAKLKSSFSASYTWKTRKKKIKEKPLIFDKTKANDPRKFRNWPHLISELEKKKRKKRTAKSRNRGWKFNEEKFKNFFLSCENTEEWNSLPKNGDKPWETPRSGKFVTEAFVVFGVLHESVSDQRRSGKWAQTVLTFHTSNPKHSHFPQLHVVQICLLSSRLALSFVIQSSTSSENEINFCLFSRLVFSNELTACKGTKQKCWTRITTGKGK